MNELSKNKAIDRIRWAKKHPQRNREIHDLSRIKKTCKTKNYNFNLDKKWMQENYSKRCAATGLEFDYSALDGAPNPFAPSVDRIDSSRGYTKDNCQVVVWIYNRAKGIDDIEAVYKMACALVNQFNSLKNINAAH